MNQIKLKYKMDTFFMNSENNKTSDSHRPYSIFQIK